MATPPNKASVTGPDDDWLPHDPTAACITKVQAPSTQQPFARSSGGHESSSSSPLDGLVSDLDSKLGLSDTARSEARPGVRKSSSGNIVVGPSLGEEGRGSPSGKLSIAAPEFVPLSSTIAASPAALPPQVIHATPNAPMTPPQHRVSYARPQAPAPTVPTQPIGRVQNPAAAAANQQSGQRVHTPYRWSASQPYGDHSHGRPRFYSPQQGQSRQQFHHRQPNPGEAVISQVRAALQKIAADESSFETVSTEILDSMRNYVHNDAVLYPIVTLVFTEAMSSSAFAYPCGRLSAYLASTYDMNEGNAGYTRLLLKRCYEEYNHRETRMQDPSYLSRFENYVLFMAELYLQVEIEGKRIALLRDILREVMFGYVAVPSDNNLKFVCRLLKSCGYAMEDDEKAESSGRCSQMDALIGQVQMVASSSLCSPNVRDLLISLIDLRLNNWGRAMSQAGQAASMQQQQHQGYYAQQPSPQQFLPPSALNAPYGMAADYHQQGYHQGAGQFYDQMAAQQQQPHYIYNATTAGVNGAEFVYIGPDGVPLSSEEAEFLEQNLNPSGNGEEYLGSAEDAEDDAIAEAYEQFLQMQPPRGPPN